MTKDVLHTIQENQAGFSKGQKRIAAYILSDYDKAAFMTASRLGCLVGVSESTVVRFAAVLGYDGYPAEGPPGVGPQQAHLHPAHSGFQRHPLQRGSDHERSPAGHGQNPAGCGRSGPRRLQRGGG